MYNSPGIYVLNGSLAELPVPLGKKVRIVAFTQKFCPLDLTLYYLLADLEGILTHPSDNSVKGLRRVYQ